MLKVADMVPEVVAASRGRGKCLIEQHVDRCIVASTREKVIEGLNDVRSFTNRALISNATGAVDDIGEYLMPSGIPLIACMNQSRDRARHRAEEVASASGRGIVGMPGVP